MKSQPPTRSAARTTALCAAALAALLLLAGCAAQGPAHPAPSPTATHSPAAAAGPPVPRANIGVAEAQHPAAIAPTHLSMPALSIDMDVQPVGVAADGGIQIPSISSIAGWYQYGPGMFSGQGSIVLVSHVDAYNGIGPFSRILNAVAGQVLTISDGSQSQSFAVASVQQTAKSPAEMPAIFTKTGPPRLVLVTCGGVYNSAIGHYDDNVILVATPTGT